MGKCQGFKKGAKDRGKRQGEGPWAKAKGKRHRLNKWAKAMGRKKCKGEGKARGKSQGSSQSGRQTWGKGKARWQSKRAKPWDKVRRQSQGEKPGSKAKG